MRRSSSTAAQAMVKMGFLWMDQGLGCFGLSASSSQAPGIWGSQQSILALSPCQPWDLSGGPALEDLCDCRNGLPTSTWTKAIQSLLSCSSSSRTWDSLVSRLSSGAARMVLQQQGPGPGDQNRNFPGHGMALDSPCRWESSGAVKLAR